MATGADKKEIQKRLKSYRLAITGGSGFVGTYLRKSLSDLGVAFINIDIEPPKIQFAGETYVPCDVSNLEDLRSLWQEVDCIVHLAALVSVPECQLNPVGSTSVNFLGTQNICEMARCQSSPCKVVFASSSAVYGNQGILGQPIDEDSTLEPLSFYGLQKKWSEEVLHRYAIDFAISSIALRFFNIFGTGQKFSSPYSGVISKFSYLLAHNKQIEVYNNGINTRDFIHVSDIVSAIESAVVLQAQSSEVPFLIFNIGTGRPTTVLELSHALIEIAKKAKCDAKMKLVSGRPEDVLYSLASVDHAKEKMNWQAKEFLPDHLTSIFENIQRAIE